MIGCGRKVDFCGQKDFIQYKSFMKMVFFKFWPENIKKASITLQALKLKLDSLNET